MKFTRKFYGRMFIFAGGFAALATLLFQTAFDRIEIDHERDIVAWFIALPIIYGAALSLFTYAMAKHHTNVLRRYEYGRDGAENVFYTVFAVLIILISAGELVFLMYKLLPLLEKAYIFALKDAQIKNETPAMREEIISIIDAKYARYKTAAHIGAGLCFAVRCVSAVLSARKLIGEYRDPPDYWSGKKSNR